MRYAENICQLVIRNMAIIEESPKVVDEVERILFSEINRRIEKCISVKDDWKGCYSLLTGKKGETTFAPCAWPENDSGMYGAWYTLASVEPNGSDMRWLSVATGLQNTALCFEFGIGTSLVEVSAQKSYPCQEFFSKTPALEKAGFMYKKSGEIYLPFTFDADALANEFPDFDGALSKLGKALDTLFEVHPLFDGFVRKIQKRG